MELSLILAVFLVAFAIVVLVKTIKIVPQKQVLIVERLGKFHKTAQAGLNVIVPFFDSIRAQIDLREEITPIEPQPVISRDNVTMLVDAVIYFVVVDPVRATYEVQNLHWGIEQLTLSALRNTIGSMDLDHTLTSRDTINTSLRAALDSSTQQWGVKVLRVELKNINPPAEIKLTMEKQMTAERSRRAVVTMAEGEKSASILRAEGEKQSKIVSAEGDAEARLKVANAEAQAITAIAQSIGKYGSPTQYLIAQKYLESLIKISEGSNKSVFIPYEATGVLASLGGIKDLLSGNSGNNPPEGRA